MARDISDPSTFTGPGKKATPKKKPATKKGKMPAGLLERFKSKGATSKTDVAAARKERAAKRAERMGNKADALNTKKSKRTKNVEKLVAARKAKKATATKTKKQSSIAKGEAAGTAARKAEAKKNSPRLGNPYKFKKGEEKKFLADKAKKKKAGTAKTTKGIKHVGQERTADGKAKPKKSKDKIVAVEHKQPPKGYWKK